jgi:hypothetical protein
MNNKYVMQLVDSTYYTCPEYVVICEGGHLWAGGDSPEAATESAMELYMEQEDCELLAAIEYFASANVYQLLDDEYVVLGRAK